MSVTYLNLSTQSTVFDSSGAGKAALAPDTGQYWLPRLVRVATRSQALPVPYCGVYHGAPTVIDPTTFIDDTFTGNSDTTSMVAGIQVQRGEAITAQWQRGTPGDVGILSVYGLLSDTPLDSGLLLPQVPAVHFSGRVAQNPIVIPRTVLNLAANQNLSVAGKLYVGNSSALLLILETLNNLSFDVSLNWYDLAGNVANISDNFTVYGPGNNFQGVIRPKLPQLDIKLTASSLGAQVGVSLFSVTAPSLLLPSFAETVAFQQNFAAITSGQTITIDSTVSYIGEAYLSCMVTGPTWDIELHAGDRNGNVIGDFFKADNNTGAFAGKIYVPNGRFSARLHNGDTATHNYNLYMVCNPNLGLGA